MGIRQFLDIGTGLPTANNSHEVAQATHPQRRLRRQRLLNPGPRSHPADERTRRQNRLHPRRRARHRYHHAPSSPDIGLSQPVALILLGIIGYIVDDAEAYVIVNRLLDALAQGSYLVLSDPTTDIDSDAMHECIRLWNDNATLRSPRATATRSLAFLPSKTARARHRVGVTVAASPEQHWHASRSG
jgi:hypothetical protein